MHNGKAQQKQLAAVREEIEKRWGPDEAKDYNPRANCFTLQTWNQLGYRVKRGEKAIRSTTVIEQKLQGQVEGVAQEVRKYLKKAYCSTCYK